MVTATARPPARPPNAATWTTTPRPPSTSLPQKEDSFADHLQKWIADHCLAVTGWIVAVISMVAAIVALLPGFNGQEISKKALELAEWTALKDYIEQCQEQLKGGEATSSCEEVAKITLPPPPHVKVHSLHPFRRFIARELSKISEGRQVAARVPAIYQFGGVLLFLSIILLASIVLVLGMVRNRKEPCSKGIWEQRDTESSLETSAQDTMNGDWQRLLELAERLLETQAQATSTSYEAAGLGNTVKARWRQGDENRPNKGATDTTVLHLEEWGSAALNKFIMEAAANGHEWSFIDCHYPPKYPKNVKRHNSLHFLIPGMNCTNPGCAVKFTKRDNLARHLSKTCQFRFERSIQ